MPSRSLALVAAAITAWATPAVAQPRQEPPGRTDGPEGSEVGQGGYRRAPGPGALQLTVDFGGAITDKGSGEPLHDRPYFIGVDAAWSADDWLLLEVSAAYDFDLERTLVLAGPRFRSPFAPVALGIGVKAGLMSWSSRTRFGVTPEASAELEVGSRGVFGLHYALDVPVEQDTTVTHRVYLGLGVRF